MHPTLAIARLALAIFSLSPLGVALAASSCSVASGSGTTALIELYTSEGCDSCPPADRWLSTLKGSKRLPAQAVPLALHVDYWDKLGWQDRYASPQFSRRQSEQVRLRGGRTVYTPQVLLDGRDFRDWQDNGAFANAVRAINARPAKASLSLHLHSDKAGEWLVDLSGVAPNANVAAYVAVYENGLSSDVAAGENRGKRLSHDFVARNLIGPLKIGSGGRFQHTLPITIGSGIDYAKAGVAVFLQDAASGEIYQAVALDFCLG